jgi:hypothetical protein
VYVNMFPLMKVLLSSRGSFPLMFYLCETKCATFFSAVGIMGTGTMSCRCLRVDGGLPS